MWRRVRAAGPAFSVRSWMAGFVCRADVQGEIVGTDMTIKEQAGRGEHPGRARTRRAARIAVAGTGVAGYSWLAGMLAPFTTASLISVLIPFIGLSAVAYRWPPKRIPPPRRLDITGVSYWAIAVIAFFEWEAAGYRDGSQWWHPTLSIVLSPWLHHHVLKSAAFAAWLMAGWGLVKR